MAVSTLLLAVCPAGARGNVRTGLPRQRPVGRDSMVAPSVDRKRGDAMRGDARKMRLRYTAPTGASFSANPSDIDALQGSHQRQNYKIGGSTSFCRG